ncbi:MAG: hypothetical protein AAF399_17585 [Bacteroidota bacterium]
MGQTLTNPVSLQPSSTSGFQGLWFRAFPGATWQSRHIIVDNFGSGRLHIQPGYYQSNGAKPVVQIVGKLVLGGSVASTGAWGHKNYSGASPRLFVDGSICAESITVALENDPACWPDYAFHPDYRLIPLRELTKFIENERHLPGVPSASEMVETGLDLGEITVIQQEKIEELFLYIIDLQHQIDSLTSALVRLEK